MMSRNCSKQKANCKGSRITRAGAFLLMAIAVMNLLVIAPVRADGWGPGPQYCGDLPQLPRYGAAAYINYPYCYNEYIKPQCGPGYEYKVFRSMNGRKHLYNPDEMTRADIYFTVGDWAYVGFGYSDGRWRYGFFRKDVFTPYDCREEIPDIYLVNARYGRVNQTTVPYSGPSWNSGEYESCKLYAGDELCACMESNGWYLCRFYNNHSNNYGYVYLWIPGSAICW